METCLVLLLMLRQESGETQQTPQRKPQSCMPSDTRKLAHKVTRADQWRVAWMPMSCWRQMLQIFHRWRRSTQQRKLQLALPCFAPQCRLLGLRDGLWNDLTTHREVVEFFNRFREKVKCVLQSEVQPVVSVWISMRGNDRDFSSG